MAQSNRMGLGLLTLIFTINLVGLVTAQPNLVSAPEWSVRMPAGWDDIKEGNTYAFTHTKLEGAVRVNVIVKTQTELSDAALRQFTARHAGKDIEYEAYSTPHLRGMTCRFEKDGNGINMFLLRSTRRTVIISWTHDTKRHPTVPKEVSALIGKIRPKGKDPRHTPFSYEALSPKQNERFFVVAEKALQNAGVKFYWDGDQAELGDRQIAFGNTLSACIDEPEAEWQGIVNERVKQLLTMLAKQDTQPEFKDFESLRKQLRIRLYAADLTQHEASAKWVFRTDIPETISVIVIDYPTQISFLSRAVLTQLKLSEQDVWKAAEKNSLPIEPDAAATTGPSKESLMVLTDPDGMYITTQALNLGRIPHLRGTAGTFFAFGNRESMVVLKANPGFDPNRLKGLIPIIGKDFARGPGAISPHLYWFDGTSYHQLTKRSEGDKIVLSLPKKLLAALKTK